MCAARHVCIDEIDELVWTQVLALLENAELIKAEIDRRLQTLRAEHSPPGPTPARPHPRPECAAQADRRLPGTADHARGTPRLHPELRKREATLRAEMDGLDTQVRDAEPYLRLSETLDAFRARLTANAKTLSIEQRQEIVRLVVREVLLGDDDVTIRHSIPLPNKGRAVRYCIHSIKREATVPLKPLLRERMLFVGNQAGSGR